MIDPNLPKKCQNNACRSRRTGWNESSDGNRTPIMDIGFADVYVRNINGELIIALCCRCYDEQLYKVGRGRFSELQGNDPMLTPAHVKSHWDKLTNEQSPQLFSQTAPIPHSLQKINSALDELADRYSSDEP